MKKRFTKLFAALALLAFFIPMGLMAAEGDTHDMGITQSTGLNNNASIPSVNIAEQSYSVKTVTINWRYNKNIENPVTIEVLVGGSSWGTQTITGNTTDDAIFNGASTTGAIVINFTNNTGSGTGHGTFYVNSVVLTEGAGSGPAPTHTVTFSINGDTSNTATVAEGAAITFPTNIADVNGKKHVGWVSSAISGTTNTAPSFVTNATMGNGDVTYYAVFADVEEGADTYEKLSSNSFDTNATYVIGAEQASNNTTMWYFSSYENTNVNINWGVMTSSPETTAPIKFTLSGSATALVAKDENNNYLAGLTTGKFKMSTTSTTVALTNTGTILNSNNGSYNLRHNYNGGKGGLRWYNGTTGTSAYFYKVISGITYSNYCTTVSASAPSIIADNKTIAYDVTSSSIAYTINNGQANPGTLTAEVKQGSTISNLQLGTITNSAVPFTCDNNNSNIDRTATITLTYTYGSNETVTKDVTITHTANPNLANIGALTAQTAGNYTVSLTNALVTYVNGTNAYLEDASGAVLLYGCAGTLAVGDKITGTANVTYTVYNNLPEVTAFTLATGYTLTSGNTVTPAVVTIADLENNYTSYISRYVKIENATVTSAFSNKNCTIEQNSSSIVLRDQNSSATLTSNVGDHVTVTAHPSIYSTTHQIAVYEQSQIVVAKVDPTITFNNGSVRVGQTLDLSTLFTSNSNGAVTYSITAGGSYATLSGSELTGTAEGSVTVKAAQAETTSYNEGEATATITVNPALVLSSIAVTTPPTKTTYNEGESFDPTGMVVTATYTDNSTNAVTGYTYLPDGALATTDTEITISYTENNVTKTTTQAITVNEVVDYATLPFEFDGGKADIENTVGLTQNGIDNSDYSSSPKLKFKTEGCYLILKINETPGELTFNIKGNGMSGSYEFSVMTSTDGITYETNTSYTSISGSTESKTINNLASDVRYIKWVYTTKDQGNVGLGNIALAAYVAPGNSAPVWSELPTPTIAVNAEYELNLSTYVTGVPTPTISISTSVSSNLYEFEDGLFMFQPTAAGTYEFTFTASNSEGTADATLTVTAAEVATYTLATSITSGRHYVIAASTSNVTKAMGGKNATKDYYDAIDASIDGNTITVPANSEIQEFVIVGPNAAGYYYIYDPVADGYLYASSSGSNDLSYQTPNDANGLWEINFTENTVTAKGTNTHNLLRYNSGNPRFSCYTSGQTAIAFYEKNETTPQYDFYMDIAAWSSNASDKWYFIALPVSGTYTLSDSYMVTGNYDLYRLNNITWENYKNNEHADFTTLNNGTGYLYANSANTTLHFSGDINEFTTEGNANVKNLSDGWNLIGNPYNIPIYINKPYYRMNATGTAVETADDITSVAIPAGTGVIVKATGDSESVTFSTTAPEGANNGGNIQMSVLKNNVRGNDVQDKAIISFNEGSKLEKFQLFEGNAKLYIPQNGEDYAIAFSNRQGDMPLNFKTTEAGMYTISFEGDNMDLKGVHLIDMLAEEKIDLSVDPSYTFIGSPADKAERFKIVFSPSTGSGADIFAYQSGSDIIVSGEGELQIFDVMGRKVKTQYVSGVQTVNVNAQGVYIMKLNEKTQKIIVR